MSELSPLRELNTTASQAPVIVNGDAGQLYKLWQERVGLIPTQDLSDVLAVQLGKHCEPFILDWIERIGHHEINERQRFITHPKRASISATLDGYRAFDNAVIEAKTCSPFGDQRENIIWYAPQVLIQMRCRQAARGVLAILRGFSLEEIEVEINDAYEDQVWARIDAFQACVDTMTPPVPQPELVPPEKWRTINLATIDPLPNWGMPMIQTLRLWSDTRAAHDMHVQSKADVKEMLPDDVGTITYGSVSVRRAKNNAVTIREKELAL